MSSPPPPKDTTFLRRWSHRKLAVARERAGVPAAAVPPPSAAAASPAPDALAQTAPVMPAEAAPAVPTATKTALPPVDTLTFDSDFAAFLQPKVDETMRRQALRKLFSDPRFNVMDGLDTYIDDYSKSVPIPADMVAKLRHARDVLDPPKTRVNPQGFVEDVPDEPTPVLAEAPAVEDGGAAGPTQPDAAADTGTAPPVATDSESSEDEPQAMTIEAPPIARIPSADALPRVPPK